MEQNTSQFDETERLSSLYRLHLLHTKPEQEFDELVKLAAELFEMPLSLISLVDKDRLWIKAKYGTDISEIVRQDAFCDFAIRKPELFVVEDAHNDSRFCNTELVKGEANIRCYVGIPLLSDDGYALGVLSILDQKPRIFTDKQLSFLIVIGKQVEALLKLRLRNLELEETNQRIRASEKQLKESEQKLNTYFNSSSDSIFIIDKNQKITAFNKCSDDNIFAKYGRKVQIGESALDYLDATIVPNFKQNFDKAFAGEEIRIERKVIFNQRESWWAAAYLPIKDSESKIIAVTLTLKNIDRRKKAEEELKKSETRLNLVLAGVNDGWWDWSLEDSYLYYSPKWWSMLGYQPNELEVTPELWHQLLHPDDTNHVDTSLEAYIQGDVVTYEIEFRLLHKEGHYVPVLSKGHILRNAEGNAIRLSGSNMNLTAIKKIEQELKQSKDLITDITDNLPNGVIFQYQINADRTQQAFTYISSGVKSVLGFSAEEIMMNPKLVHQNVLPNPQILIDAVNYTFQHLTPFDLQYQVLVNGEIKWIHNKSIPKRLPNGTTQWDGMIVEITEQKLASELIKRTKQEQQAILAAIPDLLFRLDREDRYTYCHASANAELLFPVDNLLGKKLEEVLPFPAFKILKDSTARARLSDMVEIVEYSLEITKLGLTWFEARIIRSTEEEVVAIIRNITERKTAEKALQKSEANLNTVFENTEVGYYLFDEKLNIAAFNEPAQRFTTAEFHKPLEIGNYFYDYFPEETKTRLAVVMGEVFKGNKTSYERLFEKENEEDSWYHTMYSPVSNTEDKVVGAVMSTENITKRKQNEIALNKSLELLSNQNKRLLNFSYIVSHNLRSHTSNIKSILNLLPYASSEEERNKMIQLLEVASNLLNETIHNLNDVVSIQNNVNLVIEPIYLRESINKTLLVLDEQITLKRAQIQIEIDDNLTINYNPAYLESILLNFLSNAIKYSHPDRLPVVSLTCSQHEDQLLMVITDNGIGIDMEKHGNELFGMYKTFNGNTDARGVGLFITKNQIEAMGGIVEVTSELDKGTTFRIFIK